MIYKFYTDLIQALKNVELENTLLKTELVLHQAEEHGKAVETRNNRLAAEVQQLRVTSSRAVKQFEKRTADGIQIEAASTNLMFTYFHYY